MAVIHSTRPARIRPHTAISMSETVQLPPMKSLMPALARRLHHRQVDGIEHDDGARRHPQGRGGVDPVALPALRAQARVHGLGIVAALGADEHGQARERVEIVRILHRGDRPADVGRRRAGLRGAEKNRLHQLEIALGAHALDQHRADHAAPTDDADFRS